MFHPMHLHGHTFALTGRTGTGIRKDTVNVLPMQTDTSRHVRGLGFLSHPAVARVVL